MSAVVLVLAALVAVVALRDGDATPVRPAAERTAVLGWLTSLNFSVPNHQSRRVPGHELLANHNSDTNLALSLYAR